YAKNQFYPNKSYSNLSTAFKNGYGIGFVAITPIEYNPITKEAFYYKKITVNLITKTTAVSNNAQRFLKNTDSVKNSIKNIVDNPLSVSNYSLRDTRDLDTEYLIIAEQSKISIWEQFRNEYQKLGLSTEIEAVETILSETEGADDQEKIRNFIINYYENSDLRFLLLAGDTNIIPSRGFRAVVGEHTENNIPADIYYSSFDTNWDEDSDGLYGESAEFDLAPEIAVGRFTYDNNNDILNEINKALSYSKTPVADEVKSALMMGEYLWEGPTWGGDYMDEMIGGSNAHGYDTAGVPLEDWSFSFLYEREGDWGPTQCVNQLSQGPNLVNHLGHSNTTYGMHLYNDNITASNITNNGINHNFSVAFTQGCYSGAFDNRDTNGNYGQDCLTEKFVELENGIVSMVANSRYGWGQQGSTDGASQYFHRQFIDAIFGEQIFTAGEALVDAKIDNIPFIDQGVMFWCHYETNLIGDPALSIWTENPIAMAPSHPNEILMGSNTFSIEVGIANAVVTLIHENEIIGKTISNSSGTANIFMDSSISFAGDISLNINAHNYIPYENTILSIPDDGAYVIAEVSAVNEIGGNIDGSIQANDVLSFDLNLENIGSATTSNNLEISLSTTSEFVEMEGITETIPLLDQGQTDSIDDIFSISLLPGIPDFSIIQFAINITDGENQWNSFYSLEVVASSISYKNYSFEVIGGNDNVIDPGESINVYVTYQNIGHGFGYGLQIMATETDANIDSDNIFANIEQIDPQSDATTEQPFEFTIGYEFEGNSFQIDLLETDSNGYMDIAYITIPVGLSMNNFEDGIGQFTHESLSNNYGDEWHLSDFRNFSDGGEFSMKCGGEGSANYGSHLHSALFSPNLPLPADSYIKFHHWMRAETNSSYPTQAWDGGIIEISVNGQGFQQIAPVG
ncbi:MAG: C25 family cysteine peptidase, partial [Candidatus Cloacimonadota bacterium]|nr:C25 family cysteine peptidase [Candidatus Cloacimonadota bacterium]